MIRPTPTIATSAAIPPTEPPARSRGKNAPRWGLNVTITTTARNDKEGKALLKHLGMPFRN